METKLLTTLTDSQKAEVEAMAAELKKLAEKLASFRLTEGDNQGCIDEAAGFATAAAHSAEELVSRCQPRGHYRGFGSWKLGAKRR